jgi:hypothetical protein
MRMPVSLVRADEGIGYGAIESNAASSKAIAPKKAHHVRTRTLV